MTTKQLTRRCLVALLMLSAAGALFLHTGKPKRLLTSFAEKHADAKSKQGADAPVTASALSAASATQSPAKAEPDDETSDERLVSLIRQWAESDVVSAAAWAEELPAGATRKAAINGVAIMWANQDLALATAWAGQQLVGDERIGALTSVAYEAARTEPVLALDIAGALPAGTERDALAKHATLQWAAVDPIPAAQWAIQIEDEQLKERVLAHIATAWGDGDPAGAAKFAVQGLAPSHCQDDAVVSIVQRWVQHDPASAAQWVAGFPDGHLRETAAENIAKLWPAADHVTKGAD
jgi:hypothetical protein